MIESTYGVTPAPQQFGKAPCEHPGCITICSTYSEPQPLTGRRLCNAHWHLPFGYYVDADGTVREEPTQGVLDVAA